MTDSFPLRGLEELRLRLERAKGEGRLHHTLLLSGPRGVGKRTLARALARGLLCRAEEPAGAFGCGACGSCGRVDREQHPDLRRVIRPEGKTRVPVEVLREVVNEIGRGSLEGHGRVAIFEEADRLQREGQNALLKTLEEPAPHTTLILTAERPEALLDTVRSRCERIGVPTLGIAELAGILETDGAGADRARRLARLAQGSLGAARSLATEGLESLETLCRPLFDAEARRGVAAHAFASRALEGVEAGTQGVRQAKIERARRVLGLAVAFARERELLDLDGGGLDSAQDAGWDCVAACFDALDDLDAGVGAELVLAGVFERCLHATA